MGWASLQLCTPDNSYVHVLSNKFCDSYDCDRKEDISDAEQLPVPSWKRNDDQRSSINGVVVYKSGFIAYRTHFYIDLTHSHFLTHTNLMWLRSPPSSYAPTKHC